MYKTVKFFLKLKLFEISGIINHSSFHWCECLQGHIKKFYSEGGRLDLFTPLPNICIRPWVFNICIYYYGSLCACNMSFNKKLLKFSIFRFPAPGSSTNFTQTPILDELPVLKDEEHLVLLGCLLFTDRLKLSVLLDKDQASFLTLFLMICDGI